MNQNIKHEKLKKFLEEIRQSSQKSNQINEITKSSNGNEANYDTKNTKEKGYKLKQFLENVKISKSCDNSYIDTSEFKKPTKVTNYRILPAGISSPKFPRKH